MSEPQGIEQQQPQQNAPQQTPQGQQGQTAKPYAQYLEKVPEGLRSVVEPVFQEWDGNTTKRFMELEGQISGYEPYQPIFDQYEPEAIQQAVGLAEQLSSREGAETLFQNLAQALGYQVDGQNAGENGGGNPEDEGQPDFFSDPRFQQLEEGIGTIAGTLQQQIEAQELREVQQEVEQELEQLKGQYKHLIADPQGNENDEALNMVLMIAANNGGDLNQAFQSYATAVGKQATVLNTPGQQAPIVGGGAGNNMPSQVTDPKNWTDEQRKEAALAIVRANKQQT